MEGLRSAKRKAQSGCTVARPSGARAGIQRVRPCRRASHHRTGTAPFVYAGCSFVVACVAHSWTAGAMTLARPHSCTQDVHSWSHAWPYAWMTGAVGLARPMTAWRFAACAVRWFAARGRRCPVASPNPPSTGRNSDRCPRVAGRGKQIVSPRPPAGGGEGGGLACHRAAVRRTAT